MAVEFYIESADRPAQSGVANEAIKAGTLVKDDGAGVTLATFSDGDVDGVAEYSEEVLSARDIDDIADETYDTGERVIFGGNADGDVIKVRTAGDTGGNESAPSIGHRDVVGLIDTSAGTLSSTAEYEGRIVQEGYTDGEGTPTTYNRSNGNFIAIGRAYRPAKQNGDTVSEFDQPVRVVRYGEVKES